MDKAICQHCGANITQYTPGTTWFDHWYDPRVAALCPQRDGILPHEPQFRAP